MKVMGSYKLNDDNIPFNERVDIEIFNKTKKILNNLNDNGYINVSIVDTGKVFYGYNVIKFYVKQEDYYKLIIDNFRKMGFYCEKRTWYNVLS